MRPCAHCGLVRDGGAGNLTVAGLREAGVPGNPDLCGPCWDEYVAWLRSFFTTVRTYDVVSAYPASLREKFRAPLLKVVALSRDVPERGLARGQIGTVVEVLGPGVWEVEFTNENGQTRALTTLFAEDLVFIETGKPKEEQP